MMFPKVEFWKGRGNNGGAFGIVGIFTCQHKSSPPFYRIDLFLGSLKKIFLFSGSSNNGHNFVKPSSQPSFVAPSPIYTAGLKKK